MTKNILLIEDMDRLADLYIEAMETNGRFKVTRCVNHIEAETLLSTNKNFAAIISDGDTDSYFNRDEPFRDGIYSDVAKFLTKNLNASLPVIVLTGSQATIDAVKDMNHADVKACVLKGSRDVIKKIFDVLDPISPPDPSQIKR